MTISLHSVLKFIGFDDATSQSKSIYSTSKDTNSSPLFVVTIGLNSDKNIILEKCLANLGIQSFSLDKIVRKEAKLKAFSHIAKIKYEDDQTPRLPLQNFYWEQIFETKKNKFNSFSGLAAMNFAPEVLDFYSTTHNCKIIYLKETNSHWHRPVFKKIYQLENKGISQMQLNHFFAPQLEMIRNLTSQQYQDTDFAQKNSLNQYQIHLNELRSKLADYPSFEFSNHQDFKGLSKFLGLQPKKKLFGF